MKNLLLIIFCSTLLLADALKVAHELCDKKDSLNALKAYEKLANQGNIEAKFSIINTYYSGWCGVPKDIEKANKLLIELANNGNLKAAKQIAFMYLGGIYNFKKNTDKAEYWLMKNTDTTKPKNQYDIAEQFDMYGSELKAVEWYLKAAKQNYTPAFYWLGKIYRYGIGDVLKNPKEAHKWWLKGAESGDYACMEKLSDLFFYFDNKEEGYYWAEKAAGRKSSYKTQYYLGLQYFDDNNKQKAAYWINEAHTNGSEEAKKFWDENNLWKYIE